jgi:putative hemolysin
MKRLTVSAVLSGALFLAASASAQSPAAAKPNAAETYCRQQSGEVITRIPYYGTNNPNPLRLSGSRKFCQFTSRDGSRIHVLLSTLYTKEPTLAALAYYAQVPFDGTGCFGNPGSCYCSQLGGTDLFGGKSLAGGSWVTNDPNNIDQDLETCIFPDMSTIDSWGLTYHSAGIIRGRNLKKVLRYKDPYNTASAVFAKK